MFLLRKWVAVWVVCCACMAFGQEMQESRLMRFPDIYKDLSLIHI